MSAAWIPYLEVASICSEAVSPEMAAVSFEAISSEMAIVGSDVVAIGLEVVDLTVSTGWLLACR